MQIQIDKEAWDQWKSNPVTKAFFKAIRIGGEEVKEEAMKHGTNVEFLRGVYFNIQDILSIENTVEESEDYDSSSRVSDFS